MQLTKRSVKYLSLDNTHKHICFFRNNFERLSDLKPAGRRNLSKTSLDLYSVTNHEHCRLFRWCVLGLATSLALNVSQQGGRLHSWSQRDREKEGWGQCRQERRQTERRKMESPWNDKKGQTLLVVQAAESATHTVVIAPVPSCLPLFP